MWAVDTFEGHREQDVIGRGEGTHVAATEREKRYDAAYDDVKNYLKPVSSVSVVKGAIQDRADIVPRRLHLMHLDMNIEVPTAFALGLAAERLPPGGIVVLDDYANVNCPGVEAAVSKFLEGRSDFTRIPLPTGQAILVRHGAEGG